MDECSEPARTKGYCEFHYGRLKRGTSLGQPKRGSRGSKTCTWEGCNEPQSCKGLCHLHYYRKMNGVPMDAPRRHRGGKRPEGHKRVNSSGYVEIKLGESWVLEHRWVMELHLGRELLKREEVHHRNGDRTDNRLGNLELWSNSHPPGQRVSDQIKWAREILKRYEGEEPLLS